TRVGTSARTNPPGCRKTKLVRSGVMQSGRPVRGSGLPSACTVWIGPILGSLRGVLNGQVQSRQLVLRKDAIDIEDHEELGIPLPHAANEIGFDRGTEAGRRLDLIGF